MLPKFKIEPIDYVATMKTSANAGRASGFTIIEMIGTIAIIAILITLLIPKIFAMIDMARVNQSASYIHAARTGAVGYYTKRGHWGGTNGVPLTNQFPSGLPVATWAEDVLVPEDLLDPRPGPFIGKPFQIRLRAASDINTSPTDNDADNGAYKWDYSNARINDAYMASAVVEAVIMNVSLDDANSLSVILDGPDASKSPVTSSSDGKGYVKYNFGSSANGTVYVYLIHR